jgi:hypothetical protein
MNKNHKNHKLLWNELGVTGGDDKLDVIVELGLPAASFDCYACESVSFYGMDWGECKKCPLQWVEEKNRFCICENNQESPYLKWLHAKTTRTRKKYAKIIANMKWRTKK